MMERVHDCYKTGVLWCQTGDPSPTLILAKFLLHGMWSILWLVLLCICCLNAAVFTVIEPRYEKTGFLHLRKQRRRSDAQ